MVDHVKREADAARSSGRVLRGLEDPWPAAAGRPCGSRTLTNTPLLHIGRSATCYTSIFRDNDISRLTFAIENGEFDVPCGKTPDPESFV
jgi:hypothetical protein